jgi:hypothetical protein
MKTLLLTIALLINVYVSIDAQAQSGYINNMNLKVDGSEEYPILIWNNKKEMNTSYYILEYSYDNINFNTITTRKAIGNSNFPTNYNYSFICKKAESTTYYRIVLVLMGGERIISETKTYLVSDESINQNIIAVSLK